MVLMVPASYFFRYIIQTSPYRTVPVPYYNVPYHAVPYGTGTVLYRTVSAKKKMRPAVVRNKKDRAARRAVAFLMHN